MGLGVAHSSESDYKAGKSRATSLPQNIMIFIPGHHIRCVSINPLGLIVYF